MQDVLNIVLKFKLKSLTMVLILAIISTPFFCLSFIGMIGLYIVEAFKSYKSRNRHICYCDLRGFRQQYL